MALALLLAARPARAQGFPPEEAARRMAIADGLDVRLYAAEPMVRQPVAIEFDDSGRLWVIQYLQYPNPAGLQRVSVDRYSRTRYDRVPEPPPKGPRGADRITILEDFDGDGRADRAHDFVTGLNLASGLAFGYGGVFVIQAPYLLFYPDRDRDDRPDGEPEVLLTGFGTEDAHSVANSLTWGPDGWLYGLQGSTVTARIRGIEFQQGIWRYHPRTRRFELFCEGGGNMWGLDFDPHGQLFASTNVGGFVMLHGVQGAYYWKSFAKHGALHNPYAFGYFDHVVHSGVAGGHVAVGGLFYQADVLPAAWRGRYIAADLLDHSVHAHEVTPVGSTYHARQVGDVLRAQDSWFAPTDLTLGPDGALYVTDWHDKRTAHPDPDADWDRTNGRIFVITARGARPHARAAADLAARSDRELASLLDHANVWYRRKARRLLAERRSASVTDGLRRTALEGRGIAALEALWTLHGCAGLDWEAAARLLEHPDADVRAWCVRLLADEPPVSPQVAQALVEHAVRESSALVRAQLASTARRLPPIEGLDLAQQVLLSGPVQGDPHLPLLVWWAIESHAMSSLPHALDLFTIPGAWQWPAIPSFIWPTLLRRCALEQNASGDEACVRLLRAPRSVEERQPLLAVLDDAMRTRMPERVSAKLTKWIFAVSAQHPRDVTLTRLAARLGNGPALERARTVAADPSGALPERLAMLDLLGELRDKNSIPWLLDLATRQRAEPGAVCLAALDALGHLDDESIARGLLAAYPAHDGPWRSRARELFLGRPSWARAYVAEIDRGRLSPGEVTLEELARYPAARSPDIAPLVRKHWGTTHGATREERLAEVRRLNNDLRAGSGNPVRGHGLFQDRCAACHRLHGEGQTVGPDLSFANRKDREFLLVSLVDPSGVVRREFQMSVVSTKGGRVHSGLILEQTAGAIVLCNSKGERTTVARSEIQDVKESEVSLMPESLYKEFRPDQLRDLFSYLESEPGMKTGRK
jgi:putative membrane-bound dehydrogenase-like protein